MDNLQDVCFYFPTTVLLLDDNMPFLSNMSLKLDKHLIHQLYDEPLLALEETENCFQPFDLIDKCFSPALDDEKDNSSNTSINIDVSTLYQNIYEPRRFSTISVALIDHHMPGLDGIEFCRRLKNHPLKKVIVTGEADLNKAVEAFNEGIIDKFIVKDSPNFFETINLIINELQHNYFQKLTENLIKKINLTGTTCLNSSVFAEFFSELCSKKQVSEFYLLDNTGSFLLVDFNGKPMWLIVKSDNEIDNYYHIAKDNGAPVEILTSLRTREKLPFFFTEKDEKVSVYQWNSYLHNAYVLQGEQNYFYALIEGKSVYDLDLNKIISHKNYLMEKIKLCRYGE